MWPICRDANVQGCKISSENPLLPNKDLKVVPGNGLVAVGSDQVEIKCKDQSEVTDEFQSLKVVSGILYFASLGFFFPHTQFDLLLHVLLEKIAEWCPQSFW